MLVDPTLLPASALALREEDGSQAVLDELAKHFPKADLEPVQRAFLVAQKAHLGQMRESGQPYIVHPVAVAFTLAQLGLDPVSVASGFLHDVPEDTSVSIDTIRKDFGNEIALIVDGVTKLSKFATLSKETQQAENLRKLLLAMAEDLRVVLVKLADRLHNMRTLYHSPKDKQLRIARQTLDLYAPLARRLGVGQLHRELEDLSFLYLEPEAYRALATEMSTSRKERESLIADAIRTLEQEVAANGIKATIAGRPKHIYSTWMKMRRKQVPLSQIYDLVALRVVTTDIAACYTVLGIVHALWPPVPGEFDDYIAVPKPNMYQSLHTAVIGPQGIPLEVQIRTVEMHETSEMGVAAHFRYKESSKRDDRYEKKLAWVRQLLEQKDDTDPTGFMDRLKTDVFSDQVFCFTPKGEIKELPIGATALDFAYRVHTDVGHRCVGTKINGRMVPIDTKLASGDIVEVLTSKNSKGPSRDWLGVVRTPGAKEKIRQFFRKVAREENVASGRALLEKELVRLHANEVGVSSDQLLTNVAHKMNYKDAEGLLAGLGYGDVKLATVMAHLGLTDDNRKVIPVSAPSQPRTSISGIFVAGQSDLFTVIAACCKPLPGQAIIGYVTRGRGVSVHEATCTNVKQADENRLISANWGEPEGATHEISLRIVAQDRTGLVHNLTTVLTEAQVGMSAMKAALEQGQAVVEATLQVRSVEQLYQVISRLERIPGVEKVSRS